MTATKNNFHYDLEEVMNRYNLRVVILDKPYDTLENPKVQHLFAKLVSLKIKGYRKEYPYGILPVGDYDYFGTHLLLCRMVNGNLDPIAGVKVVKNSECEKFKRPFPIYSILPEKNQKKAMDDLMESAKLNNEEVAYSASWTVDPEIRNIQELKYLTRDILKLFFVKYAPSANIHHTVAGAALRFKIDLLKEFAGYKHFEFQGKKLNNVKCDFAFGEEVSIMHLRKPTEEALVWSKKFDPIWNHRLIINENWITNMNEKFEIDIAA